MNDICFADKGSNCGALKEKACDNCRFKKTKQQFAREALKSIDNEINFRGLSEYQAYRLREKYRKEALENG